MMGQMRIEWEKMKENLKKRGLRLSLVDFSAFVEELSPSLGQKTLSFALDVAKPFIAGLGLRIARWGDTHVEVIIPYKTKNFSHDGQLHQGTLFAGVIECVQLLWSRHLPLGAEAFRIENVHIDFLRAAESDISIRYELPESERERILFEGRVNQQFRAETQVHLYDQKGQLIAEARVSLSLQQRPALASRSHDKTEGA